MLESRIEIELEEAKSHSMMDLPKLMSVEYPLNIQNTDKAIEMTGGSKAISDKFLNNSNILEFKLRPNDRYAHPIEAKMVNTDNILLKVTVDKQVLEDEFDGDLRKYISFKKKEKDLYLKSQPVAIINKTFRFREMADFQYVTKNSKFVKHVEQTILTGNLDDLQKFKLETPKYPWSAKDNEPVKDVDFDLPPPPIFSHIKVPMFYNYHQKSNVTQEVNPETGETKIVSASRSVKLGSMILPWDAREVPDGPNGFLMDKWKNWVALMTQAIEKLKNELQVHCELDEVFPPGRRENEIKFDSSKIPQQIKTRLSHEESEIVSVFYQLLCFEIISKVLEEEFITLRYMLRYALPQYLRKYLKYCIPFVSYSFRKGPWRTTYIQHGLDPRKDPKWAVYQQESFRIEGVSNINQRKDDDEEEEDDKNSDTEENGTRSGNGNSNGNDNYSRAAYGVEGEEFFKEMEFTGERIPELLSFFIKGIKDPDVLRVFELTKNLGYNEKPNETNGWFKDQVIRNVRRIVKTKLDYLLINKQPPRKRIDWLIANSLQDMDRDKKIDEQSGTQFELNDIDNEGDDGGEIISDDDDDDISLNGDNVEDNLLKILGKTNPKETDEIKKWTGIIKQSDLNLDEFSE